MSLKKILTLPLLAIGIACTSLAALPSPANAAWSCVPYARAVSDIDLKGDAWRWWTAAAGVYARGSAPRPGAVLVFRKTADLSRGHVAVVRTVVSSRKIIVDHANWGAAGRKGLVDRNVAVIDVSANNDWTKTRVWYPPIKGFGTTQYPTYGFIYSEGTDSLQAQAMRPLKVSMPVSLATIPVGKTPPLPVRKPSRH